MDHPFGNSLQLNPDNVAYGYESFDGFSVEIVYMNSELKGEYHIKASDGGPLYDNLFAALNKFFGRDCEVGFVDRTGIITLEYPIYVIVKNPLISDEMHNIWIDVEQYLKKE